jgi:GH25 family lysozyme M1 (1,4-beta-N-acetylmuramidase)
MSNPLNVVIDISHHDGNVNLAKAKEDGILGVIQKATQGQTFIKQLLGTGTDPILAECWFWLAQYGPTPVVPRNWKTWTMWQYTDGALGPKPHTVKGIGRCDRDKFNGSEAQLRKLWGAKAHHKGERPIG